MKKRFAFRNIIIFLLSVLALAVLVGIIIDNQKKEQQDMDEQINDYNLNVIEKINEKNRKGIVINEVNAEGWIELYNDSKGLSLEGYSIWINGQEIVLFDENQSIGKDEYLVVETNADFRFSEKNIVSLKDTEKKVVESCIVPKLTGSQSYGYGEINTNLMVLISSSKGLANTGSELEKTEELTFSFPSGFYDDEFALEISSDEKYKIFYTTDGSRPTIESEEYTNAIPIVNKSGANFVLAQQVDGSFVPDTVAMGNVIRAIAVDKQNNIVAEKDASYFVGLNQKNDIQDMPVISMITDAKNLFDYFDGIYVLGRKYDDMVAMGLNAKESGNLYENWSRPAYIEFFEPNKDLSYYDNIAISVLKDYSLASPQKGFKIDGINSSDCRGSFVSDFVNDNYNFIALQTNKRDTLTKVRENLANTLLEDSYVGTLDFEPCVLFINGEYWGVYALRTPYDNKYFEKKYGIKDNKILITKSNDTDWIFETEYSSIYNFIISQDMSIEANYEYVKANIDIQSYLDYFWANMYVANPDYGRDEAYIWRAQEIKDDKYQDGRWRWVIGKLDFTMNAPYSNGSCVGEINTLLLPAVRDDQMFRSLYRNLEFRDACKKTMKKMAEEIFEPNKVEDTLERIVEQIEKGAMASYQRFYGNIDKEQYQKEVGKIQEFFEIRGYYMGKYIDEFDQVIELWNSDADLSNGINWGE